jgi:hypothetical protein
VEIELITTNTVLRAWFLSGAKCRGDDGAGKITAGKGPVGRRRKPAACFARRVKRVAQKYSSFRNREIMI